MTIEDQVTSIEEELASTQYNKATSHHIGKLKAKLARLREEMEKRQSAGGSSGPSYGVRKSGNASVALVGFPSVGKSTILGKLTGAESEIAAYEFTTLTCIPGMMTHRHAEIQILDLPGLVRGAAGGRGRGREVLSVVRSSDLVLLVADSHHPEQIFVIVEELYEARIRLNTKPADIKIYRNKMRGGITVSFTAAQTKGLSEDLVKDMLHEYGVVNADVVVRQDATPDELLDVITGNRVYIPAFIAMNKVDSQDAGFVRESIASMQKRAWKVVPMAASKGYGLDRVKDEIYTALGFISVFLKPQGGEADMEEPLVVKGGSSVADVCDTLHRDFKRKFRYGIVTGKSAKFENQNVGLEHILADGDILTLVVKR